jgi:hypothetical protein
LDFDWDLTQRLGLLASPLGHWRTKAAMIYKATGNLRSIKMLLGLAMIENTARYLSAGIEDALALAERKEI